MPARALNRALPLETITLHAAAGALALWLAVLVREWPRLTAYGQICGEDGSLFGHCALCWPAAALTAVALAGVASLVLRQTRRR
ncbi:MAG: hypothetical protein Q8L66_06320 [Caulobacter sp.]|nr:hypothetical protein [Caulobacter sp.]